MRAIEDLAQSLANGKTTSRALVEAALERISDPAGEGSRTFIKVHADQARAAADEMLKRLEGRPHSDSGEILAEERLR